MSEIVVDASVAAKWFVREEHSEQAEMLLTGDHVLIAPDLIVSEFGSVLWKKIRREEISHPDAAGILQTFLQSPIRRIASSSLIGSSLEIAIETGRTIYDCLYLALAIADSCIFITADKRFMNAMSSGPYGPYVAWIGNIDAKLIDL